MLALGPPGPKGDRGRRGLKGRTGNKGDEGIMGSPGKSGKQGIMGPAGLKGETGIKGQKGDTGATGIPETKGEPGQSISSPVVFVSPATLTVNEGGSASFHCSASGNPEPAIVWSKVDNQSEITQSADSGGKLQLKQVTGNESGLYQCSATNILGKDQAVVQLIINGTLISSLHIKPRDYFSLIKLNLFCKITLTECETCFQDVSSLYSICLSLLAWVCIKSYKVLFELCSVSSRNALLFVVEALRKGDTNEVWEGTTGLFKSEVFFPLKNVTSLSSTQKQKDV